MKTTIRYSIIVLLFAAQLSFLFAIFNENNKSYTILIAALSLMILLVYTYYKQHKKESQEEFESMKLVIWVPISAICTYALSTKLALGPILSASIIGTVGSFVPNLKKTSSILKQVPVAIYCGAFVGMSSPTVAGSFTFVLVAGVFTAIFLMVSKSVLQGVGGKLGSLAFLAVVLTYFLFYLQGQ